MIVFLLFVVNLSLSEAFEASLHGSPAPPPDPLQNCPKDMTEVSCDVWNNKIPIVDNVTSLPSVSVTTPFSLEERRGFEMLIAHALVKTDVVHDATAEFVHRLTKGFLDPVAHLLNKTKDEVLEDAFGKGTGCDQTNTGYAGNDLTTIKNVLSEGNFREVWALLYCMTKINYFSTALSQVLTDGKSTDSLTGLDMIAVNERWGLMQKTNTLPDHAQYAQGFPNFQWPSFNSWARFNFPAVSIDNTPLWEGARKWNGGQTAKLQSDDPSIFPPLSQEEIKYQCGEEASCELKWFPGCRSYTLFDAPVAEGVEGFVSRVTQLGWRTGAGPSATTANMLQLGKLLGFRPDEMVLLRVTMLAWLLDSDDHTLFEILLGAATEMPKELELQFEMEDFSQIWPLGPGDTVESSFGSFGSKSVWCSIESELATDAGQKYLHNMTPSARKYVRSLLPDDCSPPPDTNTSTCDSTACGVFYKCEAGGCKFGSTVAYVAIACAGLLVLMITFCLCRRAKKRSQQGSLQGALLDVDGAWDIA